MSWRVCRQEMERRLQTFHFSGIWNFQKFFNYIGKFCGPSMWNFQNLCCFAYQLDFTLSSQIHHQQSHTNTLRFFKFWVLGIFNFWKLYREILWTKYVEFSIFVSFVYQLELRLSSQIHHHSSQSNTFENCKIFPKSKSPKVLGKFNFSNLYREILIPRICKIQIFKFSFCNFYPL